MNTIGDFIITKPIEVFIHHCIVDSFPFIFLRVAFAKNSIAKEIGELAVSQIIQKSTIYGVNVLPFVPLQRGFISIHKSNTHFFGNFLHRIDIQCEVLILRGTSGYSRCGLNCSRGDQSKKRLGLPIVALAKAMFKEGSQFLFESFQSARSIKGRIESEKCQDYISS